MNIVDFQVHHRVTSDQPEKQQLVLACAFTLGDRKLEFDAVVPRIVSDKPRSMDDALDDALAVLIRKVLDAVVNLA